MTRQEYDGESEIDSPVSYKRNVMYLYRNAIDLRFSVSRSLGRLTILQTYHIQMSILLFKMKSLPIMLAQLDLSISPGVRTSSHSRCY